MDRDGLCAVPTRVGAFGPDVREGEVLKDIEGTGLWVRVFWAAYEELCKERRDGGGPYRPQGVPLPHSEATGVVAGVSGHGHSWKWKTQKGSKCRCEKSCARCNSVRDGSGITTCMDVYPTSSRGPPGRDCGAPVGPAREGGLTVFPVPVRGGHPLSLTPRHLLVLL